jgi:hypothetical protein
MNSKRPFGLLKVITSPAAKARVGNEAMIAGAASADHKKSRREKADACRDSTIVFRFGVVVMRLWLKHLATFNDHN